ncbi:TPA: LysR family transcriptional regulator [Klebsiella oxytoca]
MTLPPTWSQLNGIHPAFSVTQHGRFCAYRETGSFTAAAAQTGVSKSTTGKHVARLGQRLGVKLLNRTT